MSTKEYFMEEQLKKTAAQISIMDLLMSSDSHKDALMKVLSGVSVLSNTTNEALAATIGKMVEENKITFRRDELPIEGVGYNKALHIIVKCGDTVVSRVLVDGELGVNICPLSTLQEFGIHLREVKESHVRSSYRSNMSIREMMKYGYIPGTGLGARSNGITEPIDTNGQKGRAGIGYQPPTWKNCTDSFGKKAFVPERVSITSFIVSNKGIKLDPSKIKAIQELPPSKSKKDVMSLLGRLNYINHFIAQSTVICEPIFKLIKKDAATKWKEECQKAFNGIKEYLSNPLVLVPPEPRKPLLLYMSILDNAFYAGKDAATKWTKECQKAFNRIKECLSNSPVLLIKKDAATKWTEECQKAFNGIKEYLSNPPVLVPPEPRKPLLLKGIELDPSKIKVIQELLSSKSKMDMMSFLGRLNYIICFIAQSTVNCGLIFKLQKKDVVTKWTEDCQTAFNRIKECLSNPPVLVPPEPRKPLLLYLSVLDNAFCAGKGIELDPSKVKVIQEWPLPKSKKDVMSFLDRLYYIKHFIVQSTVICEPIFKLLKMDAATKWKEECQKAFNRIKEYLSNPPVLVPPEPKNPLLLYLSILNNTFCAGSAMGFIVSIKGIELDLSNIKVIQDLPPPKSKKDVMSFLGRMKYINRFIAQFTVIYVPIFKLLKKDASTKWTEECQKAFNKIKEYLSNPPVLVPPEPRKPLLLYLSVLDNAFCAGSAMGYAARKTIMQPHNGPKHFLSFCFNLRQIYGLHISFVKYYGALLLNPTKCALSVPTGKLVDFIVSRKGIELDPSKIKVIQELPPPKSKKDFNPAKCTFKVPAGKLLGFIVSKKGIEVDTSKNKAIQVLPPPKSKKDVMSFLGRLYYINRLIA
ncbi:uncharacterized protein [Nicotiana tomentosiformis]|uniref:uncharacterized protein n=1 Tax=Nicotiana tomentosiformis TaxID=4098 RepID=UPI00388C7E5E